MKTILAVNAGSSSVKISAYAVEGQEASPRELAHTEVSGLTSPPAQLSHERYGETVHKKKEVDASGQDAAFSLLLNTLIEDKKLSEINKEDDIDMVCHRVVHGGDYEDSQVIDKETYHHIEALSDLAPLHNGAALGIIKSCISKVPKATNIACFDTQFHSTMPPHITTYPIDQEVARKNKLRKYGFHGISYSFITRSVADFLEKPQGEVNIIAMHLGSGASICAIKGGQSWNTSMGLTPVSGLPGATRSGDVDPSLVFHYTSDAGKLSPASTSQLHISKAEEILNKKSGWSALTGTTDFGTIAAAASSRQENSSESAEKQEERRSQALAFDILVDRISALVGSYYVSLGGRVDALVFSGGIGEKSGDLRTAVTKATRCLGFEALDEVLNGDLDKAADQQRQRKQRRKQGRDPNSGNETSAAEESTIVIDISKRSSQNLDGPELGVEGTASGASENAGNAVAAARVLVCLTDEQFEMARICAAKDNLWSG